MVDIGNIRALIFIWRSRMANAAISILADVQRMGDRYTVSGRRP